MPRAGLLKDMQVHQQHLAHALLNSVLSHRGYSKAMNIMALEQILHDLESELLDARPQPARLPTAVNRPRTPPGAGVWKAITCPST